MDTKKNIISTPMSWIKEPPKPKKTCFSSVFKKKTNRCLGTIPVPSEFTERYTKILWLAKWVNWKIDEKTYKSLRNFLLKKISLPKKYESLIEEFDKKFRVMIWKNK